MVSRRKRALIRKRVRRDKVRILMRKILVFCGTFIIVVYIYKMTGPCKNINEESINHTNKLHYPIIETESHLTSPIPPYFNLNNEVHKRLQKEKISTMGNTKVNMDKMLHLCHLPFSCYFSKQCLFFSREKLLFNLDELLETMME